MPSLNVDKSSSVNKCESTNKQDGIYRKEDRPQPHPLIQTDSGYGSTTPMLLDSVSNPAIASLLGFADRVKCHELLKNAPNFAAESVVECYESDFSSMSACCAIPRVQPTFKALCKC